MFSLPQNCKLPALLIAFLLFISMRVQSAQGQSPGLRLVPQAGHTGQIYSHDVSADGKLLVTAGADNVVILWDAASGGVIRHFEGHSDEVLAVRFLRGSEEIVTASSDGTMRIWNVISGLQQTNYAAPTPLISKLFRDNGVFKTLEVTTDHRIVAGYSTGARVWDLDHGTQSKRFGYLMWPVDDIALTDDARLCVMAQSSKVTYVWSLPEIKQHAKLRGQNSAVKVVDITRDGRLVASGAEDGQVFVWELATPAKGRRLYSHKAEVTSIAFNGDGSQLASSAADESLLLFDVATGKLTQSLITSGTVRSLKFHPDNTRLSGTCGSALLCWTNIPNKESGVPKAPAMQVESNVPVRTGGSNEGQKRQEFERLEARIAQLEAELNSSPRQIMHLPVQIPEEVAVTADRRLACTLSMQGMTVWEVDSGRTMTAITNLGKDAFTAAAFNAVGDLLAVGTYHGQLALYEVRTGKLLSSVMPHTNWVRAVQWLPGERGVLAGSGRQLTRWYPGKKVTEALEDRSGEVRSIVKSLDGKVFAYTADYDIVFEDLVGKQNDKTSGKHSAIVFSLAFDPQGHYAASGGGWGELFLWTLPKPKASVLKGHKDVVLSVDFSPDGKFLVSASRDKTLRLWDIETKQTVRVLTGHTDRVISAFFSADGKSIWSSSDDGTLRLWSATSGQETGTLIRFQNGVEVAVDPIGRFDASDLEQLRALSWVVDDMPLTLLPIELFMRDYYEPRLLSRILAGEELPRIRSLQELNRVQPHVQIRSVIPEQNDVYKVSVVVQVENRRERQGQRGVLESEVHNVRLFRDGKLVGYLDGQLALRPGGGKELVFPGIRIPQDGRNNVEFSAYAFNVDGVKSATARSTYSQPAPKILPRPKAYIISVGVTTTSDPYWSLDFAGQDAQIIRDRMSASLRDYDVTALSLQGSLQTQTSPFSEQPGSVQVVPTKGNINAVLRGLNGRLAANERRQLPAGFREQLRQIAPEDLLVLAFSCHGVTYEGEFYLLPYDIGSGSQGRVDDSLVKHAISSDDLSMLLRDVDAGEIALIIDACYAQAGIERAGFKPAPLGNRGLGQLSYEKGMMILVAAQANMQAQEFGGAGLLARALAIEGLSEARAVPETGVLTLTDLLSYAATRVPQLCETGADDHPPLQRPWLFNFKKSTKEVRLYPAGRK